MFTISDKFFIFKDKLSKKQIICILLALLGMVFVSGILETTIQLNELKGILYGLSAAFLYTCVVLMNKLIKDIDTYETSILPFEDCCTVFLPKNPIIKPKVRDAEKEESKINLEALLEAVINNIEVINLEEC